MENRLMRTRPGKAASPVLMISLLITATAMACIGCAPMKNIVLDGRYRVESVFSTRKQWMEFKGLDFWYLAGTADDGQSRFAMTGDRVRFDELGDFQNVEFHARRGRDGSILLYLDTDLPGGQALLDSVAGGAATGGEDVETSETALNFNRALRKEVEGLFRKYPSMKLYR
jgi:hypothetical protein